MRTYSVSQFKAHALSIFKAVGETNEEVVVTKRGRPLARVLPCIDNESGPSEGRLSGSVTSEGDLLAPVVASINKKRTKATTSSQRAAGGNLRLALDTHVWIWWTTRPAALSKRARRMISRASREGELLLPAIAVWEFRRLVADGRLCLSVSPEEWIERALRTPGLRIAPMTPEVSCAACALPDPAPTDLADQLVLATAREEDATLITSDPALLEYAHARIAW